MQDPDTTRPCIDGSLARDEDGGRRLQRRRCTRPYEESIAHDSADGNDSCYPCESLIFFFPSPLRMQPGTEPPGPEGGNAGRRPRLAAMTYRKTTMGATVIRTSGSEGAILWKCEHVRLDFFLQVFPAGRYERQRGSGGSPPGALSAPKGEWPYTEATPSGAAPTSPPEGVFRHKRRMELVELSGRITGRLGYTRRPEPTPSEGRQGWHTDALSSPQPPSTALVLRDDCGPPGDVGDGHRRRFRRGRRTFRGTTGRMEQRVD